MNEVYTNDVKSVEVFLALRELFSKNRCAIELDAETLAELLFFERYLDYRACACCIETAREALLNDEDELLV